MKVWIHAAREGLKSGIVCGIVAVVVPAVIYLIDCGLTLPAGQQVADVFARAALVSVLVFAAVTPSVRWQVYRQNKLKAS